MKELQIKKEIDLHNAYFIGDPFYLLYTFRGKFKVKRLLVDELNELLLEAVGEDYETAKLSDGNICQADALSLVIHLEQRHENKEEAAKIVDPLFEMFADITRDHAKRVLGINIPDPKK